MNLKESAKYYYTNENYNCAETMIHACNDVYHLNITEDDMKMMGGFGGGMYVGAACGALIGASAALSKMLIQNKAHEEVQIIRPAQQLLVRKFRNLLSGINCTEIKPIHHDKEVRCLNTVLLAAQAMEDTVKELGLE